jgi:hypothetical protein
VPALLSRGRRTLRREERRLPPGADGDAVVVVFRRHVESSRLPKSALPGTGYPQGLAGDEIPLEGGSSPSPITLEREIAIVES